VQVQRQQELAPEQVLRLVQESVLRLVQESVLRLVQARAPVQAPEQVQRQQAQVPAQPHHSQPPRRQSLFQLARCHLQAREFLSAFRQSVMALRCLLCRLTPQTVVRQPLQHHPHF